jgi:hypothetical protein
LYHRVKVSFAKDGNPIVDVETAISPDGAHRSFIPLSAASPTISPLGFAAAADSRGGSAAGDGLWGWRPDGALAAYALPGLFQAQIKWARRALHWVDLGLGVLAELKKIGGTDVSWLRPREGSARGPPD